MLTNLVFILMIFLSVGVSAQNYFFVFLNTNYERETLSKEKVDSLQSGHMKNIERLASLNKIIVAGPFEGGGGIFIFKASNLNEVQELLKTDPAISAGRFKLDVYPYEPVKGGVCEVPNDVEMATHSFIRIEPSSEANAPSVKLLLDNISSNQKLVAAGYLGEGGAILLFDDLSFAKDLHEEAVVETGSLKYYSKKLWVGKGSFCE